jgi:hypothetical protein
VRSTEAEVAAHGAATYRTTVAIVGGGTAAALLGAFLLTRFFITLPLQRMARAMSLPASKKGGEWRINMSTPAGHLQASRTNVGTPLEPFPSLRTPAELWCKNLVLEFQLFDWWAHKDSNLGPAD